MNDPDYIEIRNHLETAKDIYNDNIIRALSDTIFLIMKHDQLMLPKFERVLITLMKLVGIKV